MADVGAEHSTIDTCAWEHLHLRHVSFSLVKIEQEPKIKYLYPNKYLSYLILNIAVLLILIVVLDLDFSGFEYPFIYAGDMMQVYMHIKLIITGDFPFYTYPSTDFLGLPFGFNGADFPFPV